MKKGVLFLFILVYSTASYSQFFNKDKISFDLRYPVPVGNNFINKAFIIGYTGLFDLGVDYTMHNLKNLGFGLVYNSSLFRLSESKLSLVTICPRFKFDYTLNFGKISLIPNVALGYSVWYFWGPSYTVRDINGNEYTFEKTSETLKGISVRTGLKTVLENKKRLSWYVQFSYEYTYFDETTNNIADCVYNRKISLLLPGVGVIWKFPTTEEIPNTSTF
ncbi:MAG: hypothetical protein V2A54_15350 [Bacteroidota bacterium]